jgi:uncharacterized protein
MNRKLPMLNITKILLAACVSTVLLMGSNAYAEERPLDAPRAQGLIGERYDGYVLVHDTQASAEIHALVARTNEERRKVYAAQAASTGAAQAEVAKVYAAQILQKAPAGTWVQSADGSWTQK